MSFTIQKATRTGVIPLIGVYGESGTGKTMSGLLLARGFVGPTGKIGMVDTESRRGSLYADVIPGGYDVLDLDAPFAPVRYVEAMDQLVKWGAQIIVVDSMSHEHEGAGGVLDMASEAEAKSGKPGLHNWRGPKMEHARLMQWLLRAPVPVVCCIRAKYKTRQKKNAQGRTEIVRDEFTSPIQAEDFIFEMTAHFEVLSDHSINLTKCSHPNLRECFPKSGPITVKHGELIRAWCEAPGGAKDGAHRAAAPSDPLRPLKEKLWNLLSDFRGTKAEPWNLIESKLRDWKIISPGEKISALSAEELTIVLEKVELQLQPEVTA